jgi:hypothetical protein
MSQLTEQEKDSPMQLASAQDSKGGWTTLLALMIGYAILFLVYYPPTPGIEDEVGFVNQAVVWSRGAISTEGAGLPSDTWDFSLVKGRHVCVRNPGRSLLVLPFLMVGGLRAMFISGLLLHLATTGIAACLLVRLDRSPLWAALVLFHPTLSIYSRPIMGDEVAGTGLLLAALAITSPAAGAGIWAGLAVGLAAFMRYQGGLALPCVAAAFRFPPVGPRPWRDALLCMAAGSAVGAILIIYNIYIYNNPISMFPEQSESFFSLKYIYYQAPFYITTFLLIWPGMLLAPFLDRSRIRWLVRGLFVVYTLLFWNYYYHDQTPRWIETLVIGPRLYQVVFPVWIVSYAGVVDDWIAKPLQRRLGARAWTILVAIGCTGLLAITGAIFAKHQRHLNELRSAKEATVQAVPEGSLVVANKVLGKLLGIPIERPALRLRILGFVPPDFTNELDQELRPWYLAILRKVPGEPLPQDVDRLIHRYHMAPVPTADPRVQIYQTH